MYNIAKHRFHVWLRVYDENNDGVVDFTEFMVMYYIMADGSPEEVLIKIFRIFDVNSDGVISTHEMRKLITDMYGMLKKEVHSTYIGRFVFCFADIGYTNIIYTKIFESMFTPSHAT